VVATIYFHWSKIDASRVQEREVIRSVNPTIPPLSPEVAIEK
jgi:hypothetical protein